MLRNYLTSARIVVPIAGIVPVDVDLAIVRIAVRLGHPPFGIPGAVYYSTPPRPPIALSQEHSVFTSHTGLFFAAAVFEGICTRAE